jgi:hypothetical protein
MVQVRAERKRQLKSISLEQKKVFVFDWDGTIFQRWWGRGKIQ